MNRQFRTQLRLPMELSEWLKAEAKKEGRSMNAQIVWITKKAREHGVQK
ncbi:Arc family DNA-binding protein [Carnimonas bestiolae]